MTGVQTCALPIWSAGIAAIARTSGSLKVDKARGKADFLTHVGPFGEAKPLWFDLALAVEHYEQKNRPLIVIKLLDADRAVGVDASQVHAAEEKPSR